MSQLCDPCSNRPNLMCMQIRGLTDSWGLTENLQYMQYISNFCNNEQEKRCSCTQCTSRETVWALLSMHVVCYRQVKHIWWTWVQNR